MRKPRLKIFLALLSVCLLCAAAPVLADDAKPVELTFSNFFPAPHFNSILSQQWAEAISEKTGGKVKITISHGGTLTPANQCYDGVVKGLSDIGMSVLGYTRGRFPLTEVIDLPLGFKTGVQATRIANAYYKKFQPKELSDTHVLLLHAHGPGLLHTKKPVEKLEDLKGMKLGCTGPAAKIAEKLGAVPVAGPMSERYDNLQKGVIEGGLFPVESLKGWKLAEVVQDTTLDYGAAYTTCFFVVMNNDKWKGLSPEVQKVFTEVSESFIDKFGQGWDEADKLGADFATSQGVKTITLNDAENAKWAAAVKPILDEYVDAMTKKELPGKEALEFCQQEMKK
jgi:TRAP-type transport system periplasmic protein